jgi:hypothetical protein
MIIVEDDDEEDEDRVYWEQLDNEEDERTEKALEKWKREKNEKR